MKAEICEAVRLLGMSLGGWRQHSRGATFTISPKGDMKAASTATQHQSGPDPPLPTLTLRKTRFDMFLKTNVGPTRPRGG